MPRQRSSELELNFDGLTDSVTNLVGALILLVVLVIGVTKEAVSQQDTARKPQPSVKKSAGEKSVRPLQDRVNQLKAQIDGVDKQADQLKAELKRISTQVDNLLDKVRKVKAPMTKPAPPKKEVVKTVPFRPPFEKPSTKKTNVGFVCDNRRVSIVDLADLVKQRMDAFKAKTATTGKVFHLASGDFDAKVIRVQNISLSGVGTGPFAVSVELIRKSGRNGETADEIQNPRSEFQQRLQASNATAEILQFSVFPDSFAEFRAARKLAWERKFDLGWSPKLAGVAVQYHAGSASSQ